MIRFAKSYAELQPEAPTGYRFVMQMPDMPAYDLTDKFGYLAKHPHSGILTHNDPALRAKDIIHVRSAEELLTIVRDFDPAALEQSDVTYGNSRLKFNEFFITPTYTENAHDNLPLAHMVTRLMHRGKRKVACALEVTSDEPLYPGKENSFTFKKIRIHDTQYGAQRTVIPAMIIDRRNLQQYKGVYRNAFSRPGKHTLCGIASLHSGVHDNESFYYLRFHIRNLKMFSAWDAVSPTPTTPENWLKNRGYPPIKPPVPR
jgi:hypothetical protein